MIDFTVYLISDRKLLSAHHLLFSAVEDALRSGVRAIQLREKDLSVREVLGMAYRMRELTRKYRARFFINDRVDIALCTEADGVHLGQSGIPVSAVRNMVKEGFLIGVSTHSMEEAISAEKEGADFVTFGPLFETPSKRVYGAPLGAEALREVRKRVSIPLFGIGGIKPGNVREVVQSGAFGVALISGILGKADIKGATEAYLNMMQ
ncbi:MAG TPA: thiamine phosphate synthase [Thermodesulfovibrionales bacterium]|nr:thiamine phosphate synthase [Thermodesulfovibrionales bacterium]